MATIAHYTGLKTEKTTKIIQKMNSWINLLKLYNTYHPIQ